MKKLLFVIVFIFPLVVNAQTVGTQSVTKSMSAVIQNVFDINLSTTTTRSFSFDNITNYDAGIEVLNSNTLNYKTNKAWKVSVKGLTSNFTGGGTTTMPLNVINVRRNGSPTYIAVSATDQDLATGTRGASSFNIDYKATPGYSYEAGTYSVVLQYTITNQ